MPVVGKTAVCKEPCTLLFPSLTVFVACDGVGQGGGFLCLLGSLIFVCDLRNRLKKGRSRPPPSKGEENECMETSQQMSWVEFQGILLILLCY